MNQQIPSPIAAVLLSVTLPHPLLALCQWSRRRWQQGVGVLLLIFPTSPATCKQAGLAAGTSRTVPSAAPRSHNVLADVVGQHTKPGRLLLSPPSLLKVHLQLHGFSVFIDVEKLEAGKFEDKLIQSVLRARNFVLVLSPNALDKCMADPECKDWVHKVGDANGWGPGGGGLAQALTPSTWCSCRRL